MTRALTRPGAPRLPKLEDLDDAAQASVLKAVAFDRLKAEMDKRVIAQSADFPALVADFLATRRSSHTARRYRNAIRVWEKWCAEAGIEHPLLAECKDADLFAAQLQGAPASVNSAISAVSSFYSTLVKWGKVPRTPFVKVARRGEVATEHKIPTAGEVKAIIKVVPLPGVLLSAVFAMAYRGFRVGALPGLTVEGSRFTTTSKGKAWAGELPLRVRAALAGRGRTPFAGVLPGTIQAYFKRVTKRLAASGAISHSYSVHDLRHFFATTEYRKDKDLVRVSRLLNHADVKVTTKYLADLGAMK